MAAKVQTESINILELAKRGDLKAIAQLINRALQPKGISVNVAREGDGLRLVLEGIRIPDQQTLVPFLSQGITHLGVDGIRRLRLFGQQIGQSPAWQQDVTVGTPPVVALNTLPSHPGGSATEAWQGEFAASGSFRPAGGAATAVAPTISLEPSLQDGMAGQPIAIGDRTLQLTNHGGLAHLAPAQAVLRAHPVPNPDEACPPFPDLLDRRVETGDAIATLQRGFSVEFFGEEGTGKTALLRSLAHHPQVTSTFSDGIVYHRVRQQPVTDLIQTIFDDFFEYDGPLPVKPSEDDINNAFRGKRALVILDDVQLAPDSIEYLHSIPGLTFLMAGPERYVSGDISAMPMLGLPLADALALLERALGHSLTPAERMQAEALCSQIKGHPLHILQAAFLIQKEQQLPASLTQIIRDSTYPSPLTLKTAALLSEPERQALAVLAAMNGVPIGAEHLAALSGIRDIQPILTTLIDCHLVLSDGVRYALIQGGIESLRQIWDLSQWNQRVLTYFVNWVDQQQDHAEVLLRDVEVLLYTAQLALETGQWAKVLQLAHLLDTALFLSGQWGAWTQLWQWALQAGRSVQDQTSVSYALHQLGTCAFCLDDPFTAHTFLIEALQSREALDEVTGAAITRHNLSLLLGTPAPEEEPAPIPTPVPLRSPTPPPPDRSWLLRGLLFGGLAALAVGAIAVLIPALLPKPASFNLSSTRLGFGGQSLNISSEEQSVTLVNTGTSPLVIKTISLSGDDVDDFQVMDDCTTTAIPPGEDCTIRVAFTPQAEGNRLATINIIDKNGDHPEALLVSGIGEAPATPLILSFAPGNLTFAKQAVGTPSEPQSINVTNTGSTPVAIERIGLSGDQSSDFQTTGNCQGVTLDPKDTCTVRVVFTPKKVASSRAVLVITAKDNAPTAAPDKPAPFWNIPLNGEGIAPPPRPFWSNPFSRRSSNEPDNTPLPRYSPPSYGTPRYEPPRYNGPAKLSLSSPELNFGQVAPGGNRDKTLVIANTGSSALRIDEIYITGQQSGAFEILDNTCVGQAIAPDANCTITFRFNATGTGDRTAALRITDNAEGSPRTVEMSASIGGGQSSPSPLPSPSPSVEPSATARPTVERFAASPSDITPGESTSLCYSVANASSISISGVGSVPPSADNCITVRPTQTTTYRITAIGSNGQQVTGETTVRVTQPDAGPPAAPQSLTPGSGDRSQAPDLLSCKNSTPLHWQAGSRAASYVLTLQALSEDQQQWTTVFEGPVNPGVDATPWLMQSRSYWWRWTVRSVDAEGRQSEPAPWRFFSCFDFT